MTEPASLEPVRRPARPLACRIPPVQELEGGLEDAAIGFRRLARDTGHAAGRDRPVQCLGNARVARMGGGKVQDNLSEQHGRGPRGTRFLGGRGAEERGQRVRVGRGVRRGHAPPVVAEEMELSERISRRWTRSYCSPGCWRTRSAPRKPRVSSSAAARQARSGAARLGSWAIALSASAVSSGLCLTAARVQPESAKARRQWAGSRSSFERRRYSASGTYVSRTP